MTTNHSAATMIVVMAMMMGALGCPDRSSKGVTMETTHSDQLVQLPDEVNSTAVLLSATHLFVIDIRRADAAPWSDTVIARDLHLDLVVRDVLKGRLEGGPGSQLSITVHQRRPPEGGYQGIWSHVQPEPAAGVSYLVIARAATRDPRRLLDEPALQQLVPGDRAADVRLAMQAEALRTATLAAPPTLVATTEANTGRPRAEHPEAVLNVTARLIELTNGARAGAGQLYGAYLWERIARSVYDHPQATVDRLLAIAGAVDTSNGLRTVLADQLVQVAIGVGGSTRITVERALLSMLLIPAAAPLRVKLIDGSLPALLLPDDRAADPASVVLPDSAMRQNVRAALAAHGSAEARRLLAWLDAAL